MFRCVRSEEKNLIDTALQEICGVNSAALWPNTTLIMVSKRQNHVYTVNPQVFNVLRTIAERENQIEDLTLEYAGREIGILARKVFRVGLEVVHELTPHIKDRFVVDQAGEAEFLFGKDISRKNVIHHPKSFTEGKRVVVFSKHGHPLGLAQFRSDSGSKGASEPFAANLIDYGYYLRSGG